MYKNYKHRNLAIGIENYPNITAADAYFPDGSIRDKTPSLPGTPVNKTVYDDIHQFFAKLLRIAGITASGIPENEYSGFQYVEALKKVTRPYKIYVAEGFQNGTNDPNVSNEFENQIGPLVWTRQATGDYIGALTGAFPVTKTACFISCKTGSTTAGCAEVYRGNSNVVGIRTRNYAGALSDDILDSFNIEIRVYY